MGGEGETSELHMGETDIWTDLGAVTIFRFLELGLGLGLGLRLGLGLWLVLGLGLRLGFWLGL